MLPRSTIRLPRFAAALRAALVLGLSTCLVAPGVASAHAELVESTPAASATLLEAPGALELRFTEPIDPELAFVDLLDAGQGRVGGLGDVEVGEDGRLARIALPELGEGVYTVTYQVVSTVDGHATAGSFAFVIDPSGTQPAPAEPVATQPAVDGASVGARAVALIAALVALGSLTTWFRSRDRLPRGAHHPPWPLVAVAAAAAFGGLAVYLTLSARPIVEAVPDRGAGLPLDFAAPYGSTPFAWAMRAALAASALVAIVGLAGWLFRRARGMASAVVATIAGAGALAGMSMAAHAAATGGIGFGLIDWAHLLAVAAWLGGLPALALLATRRGPDGSRAGSWSLLRHHGPVAMAAAPIVAVTGIANSPLVLGSSRALVASEYGNLLVAKIALLGVAVAIGAVNHFALRGRGRAQVTLLVGAELAVAALAVSIAATMATIQPAAARQPTLEAPPVAPAHLFGEVGPMAVHATVDVPTPGSQNYLVTVVDDESGQPRDDIQLVFLELTPPPESDLAPARVDLEPDAGRPGLYVARGAHLSVEGDWELTVVVRRAGELDERTGFVVPVTRPAPPQLVPPPDTGVGVPAPLALAWSVLPAGPVGWLPGLAALGVVVGLGFAARGRRSALMDAARIVVAAAAVLALLGAGSRTFVTAATAPSATELEEHRPPDGFTASPDAGESIYLANCASCHGIDGAGDGPVPTLPDAGPLPDAVARMSSAELSYRIANGIAGTPMPAFAATLTDGERWHLVRYLEQRWSTE